MKQLLDRFEVSTTDDVDRLLQSYFRREMPSSWPAWKAPARVAGAGEGLGICKTWRSRFALAASIALLLLGQLWLFGSYRVEEPFVLDRKPPLDVAEKIPTGKGGKSTTQSPDPTAEKKDPNLQFRKPYNMR